MVETEGDKRERKKQEGKGSEGKDPREKMEKAAQPWRWTGVSPDA